MSWVQTLLLVLQFLRSMKKAESAEAFAASAPFGLDGEFLKKLWSNREEIISFVLRMIDLFSTKEQTIFGSTGESELSSVISELRAE